MGRKYVTAIVDDREPEELIVEVASHPEVEDWRVDRLDDGDIQFEDSNLIIERKTPGDFISSLTEGHLRDQAERMAYRTDNSCILLEGELDDLFNREYGAMPEEAIRGAIASIFMREGVPTIPVGNQENLVDISVRLARKTIEDPSVRGISSGPVESDEPFAKRVYGCIEGIGPRTAETLYDRFETIPEMADSGVEELTELEGIGPKTAEKIAEKF